MNIEPEPGQRCGFKTRSGKYVNGKVVRVEVTMRGTCWIVHVEKIWKVKALHRVRKSAMVGWSV